MTQNNNSTVAVYKTHAGAEAAVKELGHAGFDMKMLSIVGRDYHTDEQVVGYYNTGDRMRYWGTQGAIWGGFWGVLFGSAVFMVPGFGPLLVGGPLVALIVAGLENAVLVGGLSAIGAGLYGMGIPKDSVVLYESNIQSGKYLLIVHGSLDKADDARKIIMRSEPESLLNHENV